MRSGLQRRAVAVACCFALLALIGGGCSQQEVGAGGEKRERVSVRVSGSGTCRPLVQILADEYQGGDIEFSFLPGLHSGGGIKGVANGDLDLGMVSRELTDEEKKLGLLYTALSSDGLILAVHRDVPIDGLTTEQVKAIYRGDHRDWSELGGPDLAITVLDRNEDESAKIILRKYVIGDLRVTDRAVNLFYEPDMVDGLEKTPGAIGYFSLGYALSRDIPVRRLELDGVEASVASIEDGSYKVIRPLGVVTRVQPSDGIRAFLRWARSDETVEMMSSRGYAPPVGGP
ncbi:MAG: phosphate ABC transporter substrate-binding protein [Coriobacteriia bacterium]|nr:phosphate ABC transporter substrate-binding protein [Coriobacteriia bacterium]